VNDHFLIFLFATAVFAADFPPFRPSTLFRSAHVQTVGAYLVRGRKSIYSAVKHLVHLSDGDRLVIHDDQPESWIAGDRIVILFHGLCGCHLSPYVIRTSDKLRRSGIRTIRVDMRGFGDSTLISKSHLHGGCYQDAISVIDFVHRLSPLSKISLVGFSIGGNIILKTLGFWGEESHDNVDSAVAISPPIDLIHCSWNLRQRGNRIYESYFMRRLKTQLSKRRKLVKDLVDNQVSPLPTRLIHWDDQFTAPCWGYRGAREYYADASSGPVLDRVSVPTIILTAEDDPVVPFSMFGDYPLSSFVELISTTHGGHLGFIGQGTNDPDRHWMDWRICQWITSLDSEFVSRIHNRSPINPPHRRSRELSNRA
jgi:predicted alpha/beta-fold hydrolase